MRKVICVSGYSCSGKSTLIKYLKENYNFIIIKFGEIHKESVKQSGFKYAKDLIKENGFEEYEKRLLVCFKNKLSKVVENNNFIVIDGIFSKKCFQLMREMQSVDLTNIVLNTEYGVRVQRMMEREKLTYEEAVKHMYVTDKIKVEAGLADIVKDFEYIINGNKSKEEIQRSSSIIFKDIERYIKNIEKKLNEDKKNPNKDIGLEEK